MSIQEMTVASIVTANPGSAIVFKKHDIDFCCKGKIPLRDACDKAGVSTDALIKEISELHHEPGSLLRFNQWSINLLIEFIIENHHNYLKKALPQLLTLAHKVASVHGENHPELIELYQVVYELANELQDHTNKEEKNVFPLLKLVGTEDSKSIKYEEYSDLLGDLEKEHEFAGESLSKIRTLSNGFVPPEDACNSYRVLFYLLEELEDDTHQHVHLENNVLFPQIKEKLNSNIK